MSDVVEEARRLKAEAMDARDLGNFERALRLLERAERALRSVLDELRGKRDSQEAPGRQETAVANQLVHILGSKGGVLRRKGDFALAAHAYDSGHDLERPQSGYGIVNSYNLVQRLVARVFLEPWAVANDLTVEGLKVRDELVRAREEVDRQKSGPRSNDEYAAADHVVVLLLLGDPDLDRSLEDFLMSRPEPYAVQVTQELLEHLGDRLASSSAPADLSGRILKAVNRLQSAYA